MEGAMWSATTQDVTGIQVTAQEAMWRILVLVGTTQTFLAVDVRRFGLAMATARLSAIMMHVISIRVIVIVAGPQ
jgi:hypothetical protein